MNYQEAVSQVLKCNFEDEVENPIRLNNGFIFLENYSHNLKNVLQNKILEIKYKNKREETHNEYLDLVHFLLNDLSGLHISDNERIPVDTVNIKSIGYNIKNKTMDVEMVDSKVYRYVKVPKGIYTRWMKSKTKPKFMADNIKGYFGYRRIEY